MAVNYDVVGVEVEMRHSQAVKMTQTCGNSNVDLINVVVTDIGTLQSIVQRSML